MQARPSQASWRWEQLVWLLLLALSAAPASKAARAAEVAEEARALRRATLLRRGSSSSNAVVAAAEQRVLTLPSMEDDDFLGNNRGKLSEKNKRGFDIYKASQNVGDITRGTGRCKAWRATVQCNPSGPRDARQDKTCSEVILGDESGYCECGDYAQFAASICGHRPFTCDVMCLKFAVVTNKPVAEYQGQLLSRDEAKAKLNQLLYKNKIDIGARKWLMEDMIKRKMTELKIAEAKGDQAAEAVDKYLSKIKEAQQREQEATEKAKAQFQQAKTAPWDRLRRQADNLINAGRGIQAKVREIMPQAFAVDEDCENTTGATNATGSTNSTGR
mmetsp:Transcript_70799/g.133783  ORF Transcript_70799/g.133783 Transcript_70799/m.133783 type:complete len:331 (-) Transcript_70799:77-1069(-)